MPKGISQSSRKGQNQSGFSLIEMLIVVVILLIVMAMALMATRAIQANLRANAGLNQVVGLLRAARETSISERRNVRVEFLGANRIRLTRQEVPVGTTVIRDVNLENNIQFMLTPGVGDTPDLFGNPTAVSFGGTPSMMFMSDGTFVDANGNPLNGSVFLGVPNQPEMARAVTIVGATGRIRGYRWTGGGWLQ
jgi:prepilin-type N-terminal cleavage/methylation domain-containing protein